MTQCARRLVGKALLVAAATGLRAPKVLVRRAVGGKSADAEGGHAGPPGYLIDIAYADRQGSAVRRSVGDGLDRGGRLANVCPRFRRPRGGLACISSRVEAIIRVGSPPPLSSRQRML